ncbi:MAG: LysR family transcriptional regulator [Kiloniellales bacterium]|nr:LysR family transcriptional regulator [Kiloniellales bacterium]
MPQRIDTGTQLDAMALFARVVEAGGFSAAARELGLSKASVSKRIARLEDRLGARLLNRTTRRLSLSEAGEAFYAGCRRMVLEAEAAEQAVTHLAAAPRGTLRVNAPMSFGQIHLAPALNAFLERYPELAVDLVLDDREVNLVQDGFDVGVRIKPLQDSSLIARRLAPSRALICAAPAYLAAHGAPQRPEDLTRHSCLLYSYQSEPGVWLLRGPEGERRVRVSGRLRANNGEALLEAAVAGLGITRLPSFIIGEEVRAGRLQPLLTDWTPGNPVAVHAIYPAGRNLSPKVRVFVDFLAEHFGPEPYWDRGLGLGLS